MNTQLRELSTPDIDAAAAIVASFGFADSRHREVVANFANEFGELGTNRVFFAAWAEGRPAGIVQLVLRNADNDPELADGLRIAHVHSLWVVKHLHRRGLAGTLMRYLEDAARTRGFTALTLGVEDDNAAACALYGKLGYVEFKRQPGRVPTEQLLLMRKRI